MADDNRINLINEFRNQKGNDYIILTTFTFDPIFFDNFLVRELIYNNPNADIVVLVDAEQYEKSYKHFTRITGTEYHLVPIYATNGVFHPKVFLFCSESQVVCYVGSGNLTLPGFTRNAEIVTKSQYNLNECLSDINDTIELFKGLNKGFIFEDKVIKIIGELIELFPSELKLNPNFKMINNLERPILDQIFDEIETNNFEELVILAPFFSQKPSVIQELLNRLKLEKIKLLLPKKSHNLSQPILYQDLVSKNNSEIVFNEVEFSETGRSFHSKILELRGEKDYLLVGSPNFTISALLKTADNGNIEFSVFHHGIFNDLFDDIQVKQVENIGELEYIPLKFENRNHDYLKIFSADFDDINNVLIVKTEKISSKANISVLLENSELIEEVIDLDEGNFQVAIPESHPIEIRVLCNGKESVRRIFYDANYIFKKIKKIKDISHRDIDTKLFNNAKIDISDLLSIITGLINRKSDKKSMDKSTDKIDHNNNPALPSNVGKTNVNTLIHDLNRMTRLLIIADSKSSDNGSKEWKDRKGESKSVNFETEANKLILKIIENINIIFLNSIDSFEGENDENRLIRSQSLFLNSLIPFCKLNVDNLSREGGSEAYEKIDNILEANFKGIDKNRCSEDALIKFFSRWLVLKYILKDLDSSYFMSELFFHSHLLKLKNYFEIKRYMGKVLDSLNYQFNDILFIEYYSNLVEQIFGSDSIEEGLEEILALIDDSKDEFKDFLLKELTMLCGKDGYYKRFGFDERLLERGIITLELNTISN